MTHPDVLDSTMPEPEAQPQTVVAGIAYTTQMEIEWLNDLAKRHDWERLRRLQAIYPHRSWAGVGMSVNGRQVLGHISMLLRRAPGGGRP